MPFYKSLEPWTSYLKLKRCAIQFIGHCCGLSYRGHFRQKIKTIGPKYEIFKLEPIISSLAQPNRLKWAHWTQTRESCRLVCWDGVSFTVFPPSKSKIRKLRGGIDGDFDLGWEHTAEKECLIYKKKMIEKINLPLNISIISGNNNLVRSSNYVVFFHLLLFGFWKINKAKMQNWHFKISPKFI